MHFESWNAYGNFSNAVRFKGRFALSQQAISFLTVFREQAKSRETILERNALLFRSVRDHAQIECSDGSVDFAGAGEDRLRPKAEFASDGRVNPRGIPCLYLASSIETAISEVRPWLNEWVSVATFKMDRPMRLVDLSKNQGLPGHFLLTMKQLSGEEPMTNEKTDDCVWTNIDNAFSMPVSKSDSESSYVPTQILAEALKEDGFDGVIYKSAFGGEMGYNVALFDISCARVVKCALHCIKAINVSHEEIANPWYRSEIPADSADT